jgi:hypothetical protein
LFDCSYFINGCFYVLSKSSLQSELETSHGPVISGKGAVIGFNFFQKSDLAYIAVLQQRYQGLSQVADDIRNKHNLDVVADKEFQTLKSKWVLIKDHLEQNPRISESEQAEFINGVLSGAEATPATKPATTQQSGMFKSFVSSVSSQLSRISPIGGTSHDAKNLKDPDFVEQLRPLEESYPVLSELTQEIYDCLRLNLENLEKEVLQDQVDSIISTEQQRQTVEARSARDQEFEDGKQQAFEALLSSLREAMGTTSQYVLLAAVGVGSAPHTNKAHTSCRTDSIGFEWQLFLGRYL